MQGPKLDSVDREGLPVPKNYSMCLAKNISIYTSQYDSLFPVTWHWQFTISWEFNICLRLFPLRLPPCQLFPVWYFCSWLFCIAEDHCVGGVFSIFSPVLFLSDHFVNLLVLFSKYYFFILLSVNSIDILSILSPRLSMKC